MTDSGATLTYWQVTAMTATGRITAETLGNGLTTTKTWDALDRPTINQVNNGATALQHYSYQHDTIGNMTQRVDVVQSPDLTETLTYDKLNRLTQSSGSGLTTRAYAYNAIGNITSQSGKGTYRYDASGSCTPGTGGGAYAVKCIEGTVNGFVSPAFSYDANGNMTAGMGRTLTYTSYNMPSQVVGVGYSGGASTTYDYVYNAEHERTKLTHSTLGAFIYLHPAGKGQLLYEKQTEASPSTRIEHKYTISAGGVAVAVHYARENPNATEASTATRYMHQDHLGSITLITNEAGAEVERLAYEPYGKRRHPAGTDDATNGLFGQVTDRGFTNHEHLDEIALIHMNGRVYDPVLGRFVTADPFLQNPGDLQSYNRYSYVLNNPLMYTDPTGYLSFKSVFKAVAIAVVVYVTAGAASAALMGSEWAMITASQLGTSMGAVAGVVGGAAGGFVGGFIAGGGNFEAGLQGALSGGLFGAAGLAGGTWSPERFLAHAGAGCVSSAVGGGSCGRGAASAVVGKLASNLWGDPPGQASIGGFIASVVAGGTTSAIGGGKFENGATTAAFGYLFNQAMSRYKDGSLRDPKTGVKYHTTCASTDCLLYGANRDNTDSGTQAYDRAQNERAIKGVGDAASALSMVNPASATTKGVRSSKVAFSLLRCQHHVPPHPHRIPQRALPRHLPW